MTARNRRRAQGRDVPSLSLRGIAAAASGGARFPAPQDRRPARGPCTGSCTPAALGLRPDGPQGMRFLRRGRRYAQGRRTCRETGSFPVGRQPSPKRCLTACRGEAAVSLIYVKKGTLRAGRYVWPREPLRRSVGGKEVLMNRQIRRCALWMMLPAVILVLFVSLYPLLNSIQMSFTNKNILKPNATKFVGLSNFEDILTDPEFYDTIRVSLIYALGCAFASYAIGLGIATLLNKEIRFRGLFRAVLLIPWAIPTVVAASNWSYLLNDQYGPINTWLMNWGIIDSPILFLADTSLVLFTVVLVGTWKSYPFMALSLLAGMQNIDRSIYESAQIDGASGRQAFWYITLPGLKQVSLVVTTLMFIWGFNNFDIIFLLTSGGPLNATRSLSIYTYNLAFYRGRMGYSAAISLITFVLMIGFYWGYQRLLKLDERKVS